MAVLCETRMSEPLISHTDFVLLPITDFEQAEAFYSGVLGLPVSKRYRGGVGGEVETGNLTVMLLDMAKIGREFAPSTGAIALRVDDVEAARAELERRGVRFQGEIIDSGVCHQAIFQDPDGNMLSLHHRYAPPDADG
jgi:catechol 2,3-dioxygenase-like lactoylglutathione lyase family enzyme